MRIVPSSTQREGKRQEDHAEAALVRAGYTIIARNWRGGGGEIDRIALDRDVLVFVEVRARTGVRHGRPGATVGRAKQRKVVRAALAYRRPPGLRIGGLRFDVVEVVFGSDGRPHDVRILRGAFDAGVLCSRGSAPMF